MLSEIKLVTMGVIDLDRSIAFYADALGYEEISRTRVDHEALSEAWRVPQGVDGRYAIMGRPGIDSGMLRLVEWTPPGEHVWAAPAREQDLGLRAIGVRVREVHAAWDLLGQVGAREKSRPTYWEVEQNIAAWDSRCLDPDGTLLGIFQVVGEIERTLGPFPQDGNATEVQCVSIRCHDARRSAAFYTALGYETLYDREIEHVWSFFGLPQGTRIHRIELIRPGGPSGGRIELHESIGLQAKSLKTRATPPALGPLLISMRVQDLQAARTALKGLGAKPIGAARYDCPPFGPVAAETFFGEDDEVIEIFETV